MAAANDELAINDEELACFLGSIDRKRSLECSGNGVDPDLWCPEWKRIFDTEGASDDDKASGVKHALHSMKRIARALSKLSTSLQATLDVVTAQSASTINAAGLSSIPDDILAGIFELYINSRKFSSVGQTSRDERSLLFAVHDSTKLASVNRRFRRVALSIPGIWEEVNNLIGEAAINELKSRCSNPNVHMLYHPRRYQQKDGIHIEDFLSYLHPIGLWSGLHLEADEEHAKEFFDKMQPLGSTMKFTNMKRLHMDVDASFPDTRNNRHHWTNIPLAHANVLASWDLMGLRKLYISGFVPPPMRCSNLRECELLLPGGVFDSSLSCWDVEAIKMFLHSVSSVESLSLHFLGARSRPGHQTSTSKPVKFSRIASLSLIIAVPTKTSFIDEILQAIEPENDTLHELAVKIYRRYLVKNSDDSGANLTNYIYCTAIFDESRLHQKFMTVKKLHLIMEGIKGGSLPDALSKRLSSCIPLLQNLHLRVPICGASELKSLFEACEALQRIHLECERWREVAPENHIKMVIEKKRTPEGGTERRDSDKSEYWWSLLRGRIYDVQRVSADFSNESE